MTQSRTAAAYPAARTHIMFGAKAGAVIGAAVGIALINLSLLLTPPPPKVDPGFFYFVVNSAGWGVIGLLVGVPVGVLFVAIAVGRSRMGPRAAVTISRSGRKERSAQRTKDTGADSGKTPDP